MAVLVRGHDRLDPCRAAGVSRQAGAPAAESRRASVPARGAPAGGDGVDEVSKVECVEHHQDAQVARREGRLLDARAALLLCSRASCPGAIRADCVDWLEQVSRSLPSVVVTARARGPDVADVKVFVDGKLVAERLSGAALEIDPGEHLFRFESAALASGRAHHPRERGGQGAADRHRVRAGPPRRSCAPPRRRRAPPPEHRLQGFDYALGGVALASLGTFATVSSWALFERHDLQQQCAPFCSDDQVSSVATKLVIADVALGAAVVSLAVLYLHVTRPPDGRGSHHRPREPAVAAGAGDPSGRSPSA